MKRILAILLMLFMLPTVASAQTYLWRYLSSADCQAEATGKLRDLCYDTVLQMVFKCVPAAGDCDTAGEWKEVSGVAKKRVYISATGGLVPATTGAADASQTELGSTDINRIAVMTVDFDASTDEYWMAHFTLPENYDGGTFTAAISWTCTADAAKGVAWFVQLLGMVSGDVMGATDFGTAVEINDDGETTNDYLLTAESAAITENHAGGSGTAVGGNELWIKVYRDISDGDDDLTTDAKFMGIWLTFGVDALSTED